MSHESCPKCQRKGGLSASYSVLITFEEWPNLVLVLLSVISLGVWLQAGLRAAIFAGGLAAIPTCVRLLKRQYCDCCHMEFRVEDTQEIRY